MEEGIFPFPYWLSALTIVFSSLWFLSKIRLGYGIPALAVLATCTVWYLGDVNYNDYDEYGRLFSRETLSSAWWQVFLFVFSFSFLVPIIFSATNARIRPYKSNIFELVTKERINSSDFQRSLTRFHRVIVRVWMILMIFALIRVDFDIKGLFFPWLGYRREPWGRDRIGGGIDALFSFAQYFQTFLTAAFGVIAALSREPRTRYSALIICFLAMPYFLFCRARNLILASVMPGVLAWVFIRLKRGIVIQVTVLLLAFTMTDIWFAYVLENRDKNIAKTFSQEDEFKFKYNTKHLGLNMFEELAWINQFIEEGKYQPNWGERYFAEVVNPIPRVLWPGKPLIGIDYAILRGQGGGSASSAGVFASISTGMIGQGVVNFGRIFGPIAAAILMALWVALLGRQDLLAGSDPARLLLYGLGLILTFNTGRDITLIVLYPFVFGLLFYLGWKHFFEPKRKLEAGVSVLRNAGVSGNRNSEGGNSEGRKGDQMEITRQRDEEGD